METNELIRASDAAVASFPGGATDAVGAQALPDPRQVCDWLHANESLIRTIIGGAKAFPLTRPIGEILEKVFDGALMLCRALP